VTVLLLVAIVGVLMMNTDPGVADGVCPASDIEPVESGHETEGHTNPGFVDSVVPPIAKMVGALIVVVICIYAGLYLLKRMMGGRYSGDRRNCLLEVLETTYIAPKKSVSLIRVADKSVLIGMTDSRISVLTELDAQQTDAIMATPPERQENDNFKKLLDIASGTIRKIGSKRNPAALET